MMKWNPCIRPRPASTVLHAFAALAVFDNAVERPLMASQQTDIATTYWLSFHNLVAGQSCEEHWVNVIFSLNLGMILCERGIGAEYELLFIHALDGAFVAQQRNKRHGVWRFDGMSIVNIRAALEVHDEQLKIATIEDMKDAIAEMHRRIAKGHTYMAEAA